MKTLLTAHSGCDGTPDNSIEFLAYALPLAVDCVEVDVRRRADGVLILAHDKQPDGVPLAESFSLLRAHPGKRMNCDLKEFGIAGAVCALASECGVAGQILFSGSVSEEELPEGTDWYYNAELFLPDIYTEPARYMYDMGIVSAIAGKLADTGAACLNVNYRICETPLYRALIDADVSLSLWTPFEEELIGRFLDDGIFNITTRNAAAACRMRADR